MPFYAKIVILLLVAVYAWQLEILPNAYREYLTSVSREYSAPGLCNSTNIVCMCGVLPCARHPVLIELEWYNVTDNDTGLENCVPTRAPADLCVKYHCVYNETKDISMEEIYSYSNPYEFTVPSRKVASNSSEDKSEESEACYVPTLDNASIKCYKWPDWIHCDINCNYGHVHINGTVTENIQCRCCENVWKNNIWEDQGFVDCQPYLNCQVRLDGPGTINCTYPLDAPPFCEIECEASGEMEAVKAQKYECIDETFGSSLPHCAVLDENVTLATKPL